METVTSTIGSRSSLCVTHTRALRQGLRLVLEQGEQHRVGERREGRVERVVDGERGRAVLLDGLEAPLHGLQQGGGERSVWSVLEGGETELDDHEELVEEGVELRAEIVVRYRAHAADQQLVQGLEVEEGAHGVHSSHSGESRREFAGLHRSSERPGAKMPAGWSS